MKKESLKKLARQAKKRISGGEAQTQSITKNFISSFEEEQLFEKILFVLKNNHDTPTPIGDIINYDVFNKLSNVKKEMYIFDLIDKYNYIKNKFIENKKVS